MKQIITLIMVAFFISTGTVQAQQKKSAPAPVKTNYPEINIPFQKYVLDNGLTLIVHEDHKAPIIAFNIWYHVGSKNEKPGKTGFAHLFEHLMFNGSEHHNDDYFKLTDKIGATDLNGTTNNDRTNYFENFPTSALDKILWVESDRMGFMVNVIDSARLNEQRGVVQNEKRQGENQPYSISDELTTKNTYPAGHPYSWTVIGSMEDLNAASINDVKEWFKTYYGPNNAVICIAGDITPEYAYQKVKEYFGSIPPSPPIQKQKEWIAKMTGTHVQIAQDRVPQARIQKTWNVPGWGTVEATQMELLSSILTSGKISRLYKRLVYDEQIATQVSAYIDNKEIGGQFNIYVDAKPGVSLDKINGIVNEELKKLETKGPTVKEVERAKMNYFSSFIKGMERIGGFGGKSDILAENQCFGGDAGYYKKTINWIKETSTSDIKNLVKNWLTDGEYILKIYPYGDYKADSSTLNRNIEPPLGPAPEIKFPDVQHFELSNGLHVWLAERKSTPIVNMSLVFNAGYSTDQQNKLGVARMAGTMITNGTKTRTALQLSEELNDLGTTLNSRSSLDNSFLNMTSLKSNYNASLNLFADVLLNPTFPQKDFDRVKKEQLLNIKQEESEPVTIGFRLLPELLYGKGHAYNMPFTGSGTTESVTSINRDDLIKFHSTWFKPNNANLFVVGDIGLNELRQSLEKALVNWKADAVPSIHIGDVKQPDHPTVYLVDKPGAIQSIIFAAETSPSQQVKNYEAIRMMNSILGGEFTSRINMNLREDKHWSYGSYSFIGWAKGPSMFIGYAPVQTDKTKESITELKKELDDFVTTAPPTEKELNKVQSNAVLALPGEWETNNAVLNSLRNAVENNRGLDYLKNYPSMLKSLSLNDIKSAAAEVVKPGKITWVIVGDRSKIEDGIKALNLGPIHYIDAQGNPIK